MGRWDDGTAGCDGTLTPTLTSTFMQGRRVETISTRQNDIRPDEVSMAEERVENRGAWRGPGRHGNPGYITVRSCMSKFDFSHCGKGTRVGYGDGHGMDDGGCCKLEPGRRG